MISNLEKLADLILVCPDISIRRFTECHGWETIEYFEVTEEDVRCIGGYLVIVMESNSSRNRVNTFQMLFTVTCGEPYVFSVLKQNEVVIPEWFWEKYSIKN